MRTTFNYFIIFLLFLISSCSDSSGFTAQRSAEQPKYNIVVQNSTGNSEFSAPRFTTPVSSVTVEGSIISNVVSDSDLNLYFMSKNQNILRLNKCKLNGKQCDLVDAYNFELQDVTYLNITIDSNNTVYFSSSEKLYAIPTNFIDGTDVLVDLNIFASSNNVPVVDNRGYIYVMKKENSVDRDAYLAIYKIYDPSNVSTPFELIHESTETPFATVVQPTIIEDYLFIHGLNGLLKYDLLNPNKVINNLVSLSSGDIAVKVFYDKNNNFLVYEYADFQSLSKSGLKIFNAATGEFLSAFNYTQSSGIQGLLGISIDGKYKFLHENLKHQSVYIQDYVVVGAQLESVSQKDTYICSSGGDSAIFNFNDCTDSINTQDFLSYRFPVAFFDASNELLFTSWARENVLNAIEPKIKLEIVGGTGLSNSISTPAVIRDTISDFNTNMSVYLFELDLINNSNFIGYFSFDRPAVIEGNVILRTKNKLYIVH